MPDTFTGETYDTLCSDAEEYIAKESPEQARELLQKAISLIGTRPRGRSLLADTCMSMELWSEARSQLEILITLDEGNTANNFKLAQVLEELGEYQLAQDNYSVVLDEEHDHHGANVAVKRIEIRAKDSGVNLAEIFNAVEDGPEETDKDDSGKKFKDGLQVFPDVPSDELFAESEADEEDSVEKLLKNIGLSGDSTETEESDVSELLENIGVSQTLQSAFTDSEDSSDLQEETDDTDDTEAEEKPASTTLDEIFGTSSSIEEEVTEPGSSEPEEPLEEHETELYPSDSDNSLEAIFTTPESGDAEEEIEPEAEEPAKEEAEPEAEEPAEEEIEPEAEEPVKEEAEPEAEEPAEEEIEPEAEEPVKEEAEPEAEEPAEEEIEPEAEEPVKEEAEPEAEEPEEEETKEEDREKITVVLTQDADLSVDPWSPESGLVTIHLKSGIALVKHCMLSVYQKSIKAEFSNDDELELSGEGTFVLNCGSEEPLILELRENMIVRKDAIVFHTGTITAELLDIPENDSFYVIKESIREKVIFKTDHPMRVILLGGNKNVFYVRTSSIMAADPEILFSHAGPLEGYTEITGAGKVYLIE